MKSLPRVSFFILALSFYSCGQPSGVTQDSQVHEAPDALNAYQRMGLNTKPYTDVRVNAQITNSQKFWSGFYWPTYQGGISYRWQSGIQSQSYTAYLYPIPSFPEYQQLRPEQVQKLSPAEKYDLWVGDPSMTLTQIERQKVMNTAPNYNNSIPTWFGICDGWALATSMEDEPLRIVHGQSANGKVIPFYPEDIKALMAQYYAHARKQYVSAGGRCNRPQVTKDANGRVIEPECRDINPATLHLALDRFVGDQERKLIIDISRDEMVWNYPIHSYRIQYNNLRRFTPNASYPHAAPGTQFLINVNATVVLVSGNRPTTQLVPQRAYLQKVWQYVLELDASYNIIGGEWITDDHPDFVWIVQSAANGSSRIDYQNLSALAQASRAL